MQKKIIIAILLNVLIISCTMAGISYFQIKDTIDKSLQSRLALSKTIAGYVEMYVNANVSRLIDVARSGKVNLNDGELNTEKNLLKTAYEYSIFNEAVFILDKFGNEVVAYPSKTIIGSNFSFISYVHQVYTEGKTVISNIYIPEGVYRPLIFVLTPFYNKDGSIGGIVGGIFSAPEPFINKILRSAIIDEAMRIEIIDSNEMVFASSEPLSSSYHQSHETILSMMIAKGQSAIHECRHLAHINPNFKGSYIIAFAPLSSAPWGVIVAQPSELVFEPADSLKFTFLQLVLIFVTAAIILSVTLSSEIVKPVKLLIASVKKIAEGDLLTPIPQTGINELRQLTKAFDTMRQKLYESLQQIKQHNIDLEKTVDLRTKQIQQKNEIIQSLLNKIIKGQEDERMRIARDLHDTVLQDMSAFLINLDVCKVNADEQTVQKIEHMKSIVVSAMDNVYAVIKNLRPHLIDDFGLAYAIKWFCEGRLTAKGINCHFVHNIPLDFTLPPEKAITLYRIAQEAIVNIERHAKAKNVLVDIDLSERELEITIEDDGEGFDVDELFSKPIVDGRGLGVLGMKERASLINAEVKIYSKKGEGTRVCVTLKLAEEQEGVTL